MSSDRCQVILSASFILSVTDQEALFSTASTYLQKNPYNTNLVTPSQLKQIRKKQPRCMDLLRKCQANKAKQDCLEASVTCQTTFFYPVSQNYHSTMDVREHCSMQMHNCYSFANEENFLHLADTRQALGIRKESGAWQFCNLDVYRSFASVTLSLKSNNVLVDFGMYNYQEWAISYSDLIPSLLEDGVKVLIYAGDADFICNWLGNLQWTNALKWSGGSQYRKEKLTPWFYKAQPVAVSCPNKC